MQLKNKLTQMIGCFYSYRAVIYKINDFRIMDGNVLLSTDKRMLDFPEDEFEEILEKEFEKAAEPVIPSKEIVSIKPNDLADTIRKNIIKLQTDKGFIHQAKEINNSINALCNLGKTMVIMERAKIKS